MSEVKTEDRPDREASPEPATTAAEDNSPEMAAEDTVPEDTAPEDTAPEDEEGEVSEEGAEGAEGEADRPSLPWKQRFRIWRGRALAAFLRGLSRWLGRRHRETVQTTGRVIGRLAWWLSLRDKRRAKEHLEIAFPEKSASERRAIARESMIHQGVNLAEVLHLHHSDCREAEIWTDVEGWGHVKTLKKQGRPILILTGHCGNWELLAAIINCRRLDMAVVGRRLEEDGLHELLTATRERYGTKTIERGEAGSAKRLLGVLRDSGALGILIDQDIRGEGVFVPFFGRLAHTPVGGAKIALRQDAAVVPAFITRKPDGRHAARFLAPMDLPDDPEEATAAMTAMIEQQVRAVPEQWVWMHRRWRRRPPGE